MSVTIGKLIEMLKIYPESMEVTDEQNQNFIHIVNRQGNKLTLSTKNPIGYCSKSGDYVYPEEMLDYTEVCPTCDENMYDIEIIPLDKE